MKQSNQILTAEERQWITEDQKHSSRVAKVHYRKRRSRDVALRGNDCLKRLRGEAGERTDAILREAFNQSSTDGEDDDIFLTDRIDFIHLRDRKIQTFLPSQKQITN